MIVFGHFAWGKLTPLLLQGNRSSSYCSASFKINLGKKMLLRTLSWARFSLHSLHLFKDLTFFFFLRIFKLHVLGIDLRFFSQPSPEGYFFFVNISVFHTECKNIQTVLLNTVFIWLAGGRLHLGNLEGEKGRRIIVNSMLSGEWSTGVREEHFTELLELDIRMSL